jgi:hypothetical protein
MYGGVINLKSLRKSAEKKSLLKESFSSTGALRRKERI